MNARYQPTGDTISDDEIHAAILRTGFAARLTVHGWAILNRKGNYVVVPSVDAQTAHAFLTSL